MSSGDSREPFTSFGLPQNLRETLEVDFFGASTFDGHDEAPGAVLGAQRYCARVSVTLSP